MTDGCLDPRVDDVFATDGPEPVQWWASARCDTGEKRLLLALLIDTYRLLFFRMHDQRYARRPSTIRARKDALRWVKDTRDGEDSPYGYSFPQVCGELGMLASAVRTIFLDNYRAQRTMRDVRAPRVDYNRCVMTDVAHRRATRRKVQAVA